MIFLTAGSERTVEDVYISNEMGKAVEGAFNYITIVMPAVFNPQTISAVGSPFTYNLKTFQNEWPPEYIVNLKSNDFVIDGKTYTLSYKQDAIDNRISPDTALFNVRGSYIGTYMNNFTGEEEVILQTAAYEPETLAEGDKNPFIIWLHGQGEGGTDPDISILGNEVSALAKD